MSVTRRREPSRARAQLELVSLETSESAHSRTVASDTENRQEVLGPQAPGSPLQLSLTLEKLPLEKIVILATVQQEFAKCKTQ
jgi:hypothetical protein